MASVKGATTIDKAAHRLYDASLLRRPAPAYCRDCGHRLETAYHEERLYSVRCCNCGIVTLVKARTPEDAALHVGDETPF